MTATWLAVFLIGGAVSAAEPDGSTPLHWASYRDDVEAASQLIRAGAKVNAANDLGVTPLWTACLNGSAAMVRMLLEAGANPNAVLLIAASLIAAVRLNREEIKSSPIVYSKIADSIRLAEMIQSRLRG